MSNKVKEFFAYFLIFAPILLIIIYNVLDINAILKSEIRVYRIMCDVKPVFDKCDNPSLAIDEITFKVDPKKQEVIKLIFGSYPKKLTNCTVENRKNWSCEDEEEKMYLGFKNGNFWRTPINSFFLEDVSNIYYTTSKIQYLKIRCGNNLFCLLLTLYRDFY
jgi:hypothetical protein